MKLIVEIDEETYKDIKKGKVYSSFRDVPQESVLAIANGTPLDNATNGDVITAIFGADKVFGFIHYVHLMAKAGDWFNEGVVAEFDRDWWNSPYQKGGKE